MTESYSAPLRSNQVRRKFRDVEIDVEFLRSSYIDAPRAAQRHWVTNRAVEELLEQLHHLDLIAPNFVSSDTRRIIAPGDWSGSEVTFVDGQLLIEDQQVMQDWEAPLMQRMAEVVTQSHGDVLEIGFGLGLSAAFIEACGVRSHTIVELNEDVAEVARTWAAAQEGDIEVVSGHWDQQVSQLGLFDGVFWDAFPTSETEFDDYVLRDSTVAEAFFPAAAAHLRPGGVFTYYSNERDSLSRRHQRSLLRYFTSFSVEVLGGLVPPPDCEYWWTDSMCVVKAVK